jgi:hypothetical protein
MKPYRDYSWILALSVLGMGCGSGSSKLAAGAGGVAAGGSEPTVGGTGGVEVAAGGTMPSLAGTGGLTIGAGGSSVGLGAGGVALGTGGAPTGIDAGTYGGASGGAHGCDSDLTGTWDLLATNTVGSTRPGVLVIGPDTLTFSVTTTRSWDSPSTKQLAYSAAGAKTLTWSRTDDPVVPIDIENTPAALDAGSIPLALGGQWSFAVNRKRCSAQIGEVSAIACAADPTVPRVGGNWPYPVPAPVLGVTYTLTRTSQLASQFGFLGGQWLAKSSDSAGTCSMKVEDAMVNIVCRTDDSLNGQVQITVGSSCVASGLTSTGWELSARRR